MHGFTAIFGMFVVPERQPRTTQLAFPEGDEGAMAIAQAYAELRAPRAASHVGLRCRLRLRRLLGSCGAPIQRRDERGARAARASCQGAQGSDGEAWPRAAAAGKREGGPRECAGSAH